MLNKFFKLFATLSVLGVVAFGVGCSNYDNDIDNLQRQIDDLKKGQSSSTTLIEGLRADLTALQNAAATTAELAAAKKELQDAIAANAATLGAEIEALKSADKALDEKLGNLNSTVVENAAKAAADLAAAKKELQAAIEANSGNISTLQSQLKAAEAKYDAAVEKLNSDIEAAKKAAQEAADKAYEQAVKDAVEQAKKDAAAADAAQKSELEAAIKKAAENAKEELDKAVKELNDGIDALEARIDSIESDIETNYATKKEVEQAKEDITKAYEIAIETAVLNLKNELNEKIGDLDGRVEVLEKQVVDIQSDVEYLFYALFGLSKDELLEGGNYTVESVFGQLAYLLKQISNLQEDDAVLQGQIDANKAEIANVKTQLYESIKNIMTVIQLTQTEIYKKIKENKEAADEEFESIWGIIYSESGLTMDQAAEWLKGLTGSVDAINEILDGEFQDALNDLKWAMEELQDISPIVYETERRLNWLSDWLGETGNYDSLDDLVSEIEGDIAANADAIAALVKWQGEVNATLGAHSLQLTKLASDVEAVKKVLTGFEEGETVKGYIEECLKNYLTIEKWNAFFADYEKFHKETSDTLAEYEVNRDLWNNRFDAVWRTFENDRKALTVYMDSVNNSILKNSRDIKDLQNRVAKNELDIAQLKADLKTLTDKYDTFIGEYTGTVADLETKINSANSNALKGITDAANAMSKAQDALLAAQKAAADSAAGDANLQAQLDKAIADRDEAIAAVYAYVTELNELTANILVDAILDIQKDIENLNSELASLKTAQKDTEKKVEDLINRIQSLVYVPTNSAMTINLGGTYVKYGDHKILLSNEMPDGEWVTYRVSPANIAEDLFKYADWYFYSKPVTRAEMTPMNEQNKDFEIVAYELDKNEKGLINFRIRSAFDMLKTDKNLAVALRVTKAGSALDSATEGDVAPHSLTDTGVYTEFTSPYTVATIDPKDVTANFVFAHKNAPVEDEGDDDEVAGAAETASYTEYPVENDYDFEVWGESLQYNNDVDKEAYFYEDCEVVYKDGSDYYTLTEAAKKFHWVTELAWTYTHKEAQGSYSATPRTDSKGAMVADTWEWIEPATDTEFYGFKLTKAAEKNIEKVADDVIYAFVYDANSEDQEPALVPVQEGKYFRDQIEIIKDKRTINATAEFNWLYLNWDKNETYTVDNTSIDFGDMTDAQIADLNSALTSTTEPVEWKFFDIDGFHFINEKDVTDATFDLAAAIKDKKLELTVDNYAYHYGKLTFTAKATVQSEFQTTDVTITVTVNAPEQKPIHIGTAPATSGPSQPNLPPKDGPVSGLKDGISTLALQTLPKTINGVTALNAEYLLYITYVGDEYEGYKNHEFYTDDEVDTHFAGEASNVNRFMRQISNSKSIFEVTKLTTTADAEAVLNTINTWANNRSTTPAPIYTTGKNEFVSNEYRVLTINVKKLNLTEGPVTFRVPAGTELSHATKVAPTFPIDGGVKIVAPEVDWLQGSRLSTDGYGLIGSYRETERTGADWDNYVLFNGRHINTGDNKQHDFVYDNVNLMAVLAATTDLDVDYEMRKISDEFYVDFEVLEAESLEPITDAAVKADMVEHLPEIIRNEADPLPSKHIIEIDWDNAYYNRLGKMFKDNNELYNTVVVKAYLKSFDKNHANEITYDERIVTFLAEVPFNNPECDDTYSVKIANQEAIVDLGNLITMYNIVAEDGSITEEDMVYKKPEYGAGRFYARFMSELCYGLDLKFDDTGVRFKCLDGQATFSGSYEIEYGQNYNYMFKIHSNSAFMQHEFKVTVPFSMTGNFGYRYEGEISFKIEKGQE